MHEGLARNGGIMELISVLIVMVGVLLALQLYQIWKWRKSRQQIINIDRDGKGEQAYRDMA